MADMEKVIKGIDMCLQRFHCGEDCPYYNVEKIGCMEQLRDDALDLIKEQEDMGKELTDAIELVRKKNERIEKLLKEHEAVVRCKDCRHYTGKDCNYNDIFPAPREDWYCADGERRQKNER